MILCDAGPLLALVDRRQSDHARCRAALQRISPPLLTTWCCWTEAMYLTYRAGGWLFQDELWQYRMRGTLILHNLTENEADRMAELMQQYNDLPMDLADASLVALAETTGLRRIFTLDSNFQIYRTADGGTFEIVPE